MKKRPEITAATKENFQLAFLELCEAKPIKHITVKEITEKSGYNRSTFYQYFNDTNDVLNQVEESVLSTVEKYFQNITDVTSENMVQRIADLYDTQGNSIVLLLGENGDPTFSSKLKNVVRRYVSDIFHIYTSNLKVECVFEFVTSGILAAITHWYKNERKMSTQEIVSIIRPILLNGVRPVILNLEN